MRGRRARTPERADLGAPLTHHLVTVPLDGRDGDVLSGELWSLGAVGVEELAGGLRAAFTDAAAATAARDRLAPGAAVEAVADDFGLDEHRDRLTVERAGRFAIHPPWLAPPDRYIGIEIDPGHAFGSGSHPSTRLALMLLATVVESGMLVADIGCGTGVLAIAAARLEATVIAVDTDPAAIAATRANIAANRVAADVDVRHGSTERISEMVDVAVVNVTIDGHEALGPTVPPAPIVVVSGILATQIDRAATAHRRVVAERVDEGDWVAAVLRRPPGYGGAGAPA